MMRNKTKHQTDTVLDDAKQKLLQSLHLIVSNSEAHLYDTAIHAGEDEVAAKARIKENLNKVREHLYSDYTPVLVNTQLPGQHGQQNPWRSVAISACSNLIVAIKNVKH